jgi:hypothetical protein
MQRRNFNMISPGPGTEEGGCSRNKVRLATSWEARRGSVLSWFRRHGWRLALLEIRSCRQRILLGMRKQWDTRGLVFEEVRATMPLVTFPRNCSETLSCTLSIQAIKMERPYLTPADHEVFVQARFQAAKWFGYRHHTGLDRQVSDSSDTSKVGILDSAEQLSNRPNMIR